MTLLTHTLEHELDLISIQQTDTQRFPYLLDSAAHGDCFERDDNSASGFRKKESKLGRYSILFAYPQQSLVLDSDWDLVYDNQSHSDSNDFLSGLDVLWEAEKQDRENESTLPFSGGWFVFLSYELARQIESKLDKDHMHQSDRSNLPIAFATRVPIAIIVDHVKQSSSVVAEKEFKKEFAVIVESLDQLNNDQSMLPIVVENVHEEDPAIYINAIRKTHEYIHDGDIFQANLSREWTAELNVSVRPYDLYKKLRQSNPGPFAGLVYWQDHVIMSSSPERLIGIKGRHASTRPIAGTRPRSVVVNDDAVLRSELLKHPKERAEHVMLIDLERNDLGRVCKAGTVDVNELMVIESYEHVHHIVSNVQGKLRDEVTPGQAIRAVFPGGTITGCPKVRCMGIIAELENKPREAYTGSMGYLNHNGDMDLNILIRTMHLQGKHLDFRAGGGIVYDSNAEKEVLETRAKAKGLIKALSI